MQIFHLFWYTSVTPAVWRLRQEDWGFYAILDHIVRSCLNYPQRAPFKVYVHMYGWGHQPVDTDCKHIDSLPVRDVGKKWTSQWPVCVCCQSLCKSLKEMHCSTSNRLAKAHLALWWALQLFHAAFQFCHPIKCQWNTLAAICGHKTFIELTLLEHSLTNWVEHNSYKLSLSTEKQRQEVGVHWCLCSSSDAPETSLPSLTSTEPAQVQRRCSEARLKVFHEASTLRLDFLAQVANDATNTGFLQF